MPKGGKGVGRRRHSASVPDRGLSRQRVPGGGHARPPGDASDPGGPVPRRRAAAQPRHLRHHLDGGRGAPGDRREPPSQLHRPRRVPGERRDGAALHSDARRPLPRPRRDHRRPDPGIVGGDHARRPRPEVEVARPPRGRGQGHRPPQPRLRRRRPRGLGEVLPLLRRRAPDRAAAGGQVHDRPRRHRASRGREHDRGRRGGRDHLHRPRRRRRRDQQAPPRDQGEERVGRADARRRSERRLRLAVPLPGEQMGFPARAGPVDQRLGAQVRVRLPRRSAGSSSGTSRRCRTTWSSTRTTWARRTPPSPSTSPPGRRWCWPSTTC